MFVSGVRSSWDALETNSLLTCESLRSSVTSRRVRRTSAADSPGYRTVVPEHRTTRLPRRVTMETSRGFGSSPFVQPSMKARAWGWRIISGYGRPSPIVSEASKIFPASGFIIRTDRSAAMTITPSSRLASSVSRRAFPASSCPIVSARWDAIRFITFAILSNSSPVRTWARRVRLPAPISFAAAWISERGPVTFRAMNAAPPRIRRSAANPVPQMIAVICHRRRVRLATGTDARAAPTIVPPIVIGRAAYRCSSRTVMLRRREIPFVPDRASRISGWRAWFSIPGTPAVPTAESATTVPSGRTTVMRPPIAFRGDPLSIRRGVRKQRPKRLGDDLRPGEQALVRVRHHETSHEKEADGAGDEKGDPRDREVREEEFCGDGEAAGQAASAFPQLVADVLDRLDGLCQEGDLLAKLRDVDVDRAVDHVGILPPDFREDRLAGEDATRRGEERLEDTEFLGGERHRLPLAPDLVTARVHPQLPVGQHRGLGFLRPGTTAAKDRLDPGHDLPRAERFGDVVVRTQLKPDDAVRFVPLRGQHHHRRPADRFVRPDRAQHFQPVGFRKKDVEEDQVRLLLPRL